MGKYLIRVESMDGDRIDERYTNGVECNGFVIAADREDSAAVMIHGLSIKDMAVMFAHDEQILGAAHIAQAIKDAMAMQKKSALSKTFSDMLENELLRGLRDSD